MNTTPNSTDASSEVSKSMPWPEVPLGAIVRLPDGSYAHRNTGDDTKGAEAWKDENGYHTGTYPTFIGRGTVVEVVQLPDLQFFDKRLRDSVAYSAASGDLLVKPDGSVEHRHPTLDRQHAEYIDRNRTRVYDLLGTPPEKRTELKFPRFPTKPYGQLPMGALFIAQRGSTLSLYEKTSLGGRKLDSYPPSEPRSIGNVTMFAAAGFNDDQEVTVFDEAPEKKEAA